jgi:hypothetical protein
MLDSDRRLASTAGNGGVGLECVSCLAKGCNALTISVTFTSYQMLVVVIVIVMMVLKKR